MIRLKLIFLLTLFLMVKKSMAQQENQDSVPRTILKYGNRITQRDLGQQKLMLVTANCSILSLNGVPFTLFLTPEFKLDEIPVLFQKDIYLVKRICFQPSYSYDDLKDNYCELPAWIANFKTINYLKLNHVDISDLKYIKDLPIKFLHIIEIKIGTRSFEQIALEIGKLTHLKAVIYDSSVPTQMVNKLKKDHPEYRYYSESDKLQMKFFEEELNKDIDNER